MGKKQNQNKRITSQQKNLKGEVCYALRVGGKQSTIKTTNADGHAGSDLNILTRRQINS